MEIKTTLTPQKIAFLRNIGKNPYISDEELVKIIGYRRKGKLTKLRNLLRRAGYISSPYYEIDYGKIMKNNFQIIYALIVFEGRYEYIEEILFLMKNCYRFYPLMEMRYCMCMTSFFVTDEKTFIDTLEYLREKGIIIQYTLFRNNFRWYRRYPEFSYDDDHSLFIPNFENLFEDTEIPNLEYGTYEDPLNFCDLRVLMHLGVRRDSLSEIQRYEYHKFKNSFSYIELSKSYRKLIEKGIATKYYIIRPVPKEICHRGILILRFEEFDMTRKAVFNLGKNKRVMERITYWRSMDNLRRYGVIHFFYDSTFFTKLINRIDEMEGIEYIKMFFLKNYPPKNVKRRSDFMEYYNIETQELHIPHKKFFETVRERIETDIDAGILTG